MAAPKLRLGGGIDSARAKVLRPEDRSASSDVTHRGAEDATRHSAERVADAATLQLISTSRPSSGRTPNGDDGPPPVGMLLNVALDVCGFSASSIAEGYLGVSRQFVDAILRGERSLSFAHFMKLPASVQAVMFEHSVRRGLERRHWERGQVVSLIDNLREMARCE